MQVLGSRQQSLQKARKKERCQAAHLYGKRLPAERERLGNEIWADHPEAIWEGQEAGLALVCALPHTEPMRDIDASGDYFNVRSGSRWDLFCTGYYRSYNTVKFETECGANLFGRGFTSNWYFNAREFNALRETVETNSDGRWAYSENANLVLVNAWVPLDGEPTIDWASTVDRQVRSDKSLAISEVVERVSRDIELTQMDPSHGVGTVANGQRDSGNSHGPLRDAATSIIAVKLGPRTIGL